MWAEYITDYNTINSNWVQNTFYAIKYKEYLSALINISFILNTVDALKGKKKIPHSLPAF